MTLDREGSYQALLDAWSSGGREAALRAYAEGQSSFVAGLLPELALQLGAAETLSILRSRLGAARVELALAPAHTDPARPASEVPDAIASPVRACVDGSWLRRAKLVGINLRACGAAAAGSSPSRGHLGSFWNVVKYALTLCEAQDTIHLLPFWEPGVVGSLYGPASWELCADFKSDELAASCPHLASAERQLRAVVNLLHALGKRVGFDVLPHTDRFAETALAFPSYFEWLRRQETEIVDHSAALHEAAEEQIFAFLEEQGSATPGLALPPSRETLFALPEATRLALLFGAREDRDGRGARRIALVERLHRHGLEPVPATMAPPFRGLRCDPRESARSVDAQGLVWRDYLLEEPTATSRVFGPLARYKLHEARDDNRRWELDFEAPRREVWDYVCGKYAEVQRRYGFDFMRGDMSHVQMRPRGVPAELASPEVAASYDLLGAVKQAIRERNRVPWFGYFAESFLHGRDVFSYGEELDHLEAARADAALGDLQSTPVGSPELLRRLRRYLDWSETRACAPSFTLLTSDKDDPRFDPLFRDGNELRFFVGLFLTDLPSYMALGFETRDVHHRPAPNEHYTKLYVFAEREGPKATRGPYRWGRNVRLFGTLERLKRWADRLAPTLAAARTRWLLPPDATGECRVLGWTLEPARELVFLACADLERGVGYFGLPWPDGEPPALELLCSTAAPGPRPEGARWNGVHYRVEGMAPGECRIYRAVRG
jgi:hypothetical protein